MVCVSSSKSLNTMVMFLFGPALCRVGKAAQMNRLSAVAVEVLMLFSVCVFLIGAELLLTPDSPDSTQRSLVALLTHSEPPFSFPWQTQATAHYTTRMCLP